MCAKKCVLCAYKSFSFNGGNLFMLEQTQKSKLILDAYYGRFTYLIDNLKTDLAANTVLLKKYFSYFKENQSGYRKFDDYLNFLKKFILPQINEEYTGNEKKYGSKEKYEKYQKELFDILVEVNDFLWENYLFLDRKLRWKYIDDVISKINIDCFERFLYAEKDEVDKSKDKKKMEAYNKTLENFFYRNIRNLILSRQQCLDLCSALYDHEDLPDWIERYIDSSNQNDFGSTLSNDFITLTDKLQSFQWSKELDKNNEQAKSCLEYIKTLNENVKDPNLFDFYSQFLEKAVIPQVNESEYEKKYTPEGWPPYNSLSDKQQAEFKKLQKEIYDKHQNQLLDILVETNDLIWEIINSISSSEYEKNKLLVCYYNCIIKIKYNAWERIGSLLEKKKKEAIKSRDKNKVVAYNKLVKNFVLRNLENDVISASKLDNMGVINFIDEKTFEEYTDDAMIKKLFIDSVYMLDRHVNISNAIRLYGTIKIRKSDKNKKICLESICGNFISGMHWAETDAILTLIKNKPDEIDFDFSTIDKDMLEEDENLKNFCLGFRSIYNDLQENNFTVVADKFSLSKHKRQGYEKHGKIFWYLGSWIIPLLGEKTDFDKAYKILSKRLDFLCDFLKVKVTPQNKDKLIIQTLVYATNSLCPLQKDNEKSICRTFAMFTGEEKFVKGYKFSLDDIKKILSCTKNSVLNSFKILKFCKNHRIEVVKLTDIVKLAKEMEVSLDYCSGTRRDAYLINERDARFGYTGYHSNTTSIFDKNDLEIYISELPNNLKMEEFDILFSIFESHSVFSDKRSSDENKKIQKLFIQVVNKIPTGYLSQKKFDSLADYFTRCKPDNAISLTPDEFNKFMLKINKQMNAGDFKEFKRRIIKYFRISGKTISDQEIEDAYKDVKDVKNPDFENINAIEDVNEIQKVNNNAIINGNNVQDINGSKSINKNVKPITNNNQNQNQKLDESDKVAEMKSDIEREKQEFENWASKKLKNNKLWYLIMWAFRLCFEYKLEKKLEEVNALATGTHQQSENNSLNTNTQKEEEIPEQNDKTKNI